MTGSRATGGQARHVFEQRERAESFGSIAADYDRYRPTYPDALIVEIATRGVDVLDVGCGTGKASRLLAERGLHVLGVEIDPEMAAVARSHGVEVEVAGFETWDDAGRRFDVLTSAQAWHWIDPHAGAAKAMQVLRPGGSLALFWNVPIPGELRSGLERVYRETAPQLAEHQHGGVRGRVDLYDEPFVAAGFVDVETRVFPWRTGYRRDDYVAMIATHSDVHLLPDETRGALLAGVGGFIDAHGGTITMDYETHTLFARTPR